MEKIKIGLNAGMVWQYLKKNENSLPIPTLHRELGIGAEEVAMACGWLAREGKIFFERRQGILYVSLSAQI